MTMSALFDMQSYIRQEENNSAKPAVRQFTEWPAIVGLDLSMTNTGLAVYVRPWGEAPLGATRLERIQSKPEAYATGPLERLKVSGKLRPSTTWDDRRRRMADIVRRIITAVPEGSLVFLEAPSYASSGSGTFDRSGLWWWVFADLVSADCRVVPVSPAQRMQYATGKGGGKDAGKDAVIAGVVRAYPELAVTDNNVADAVVLMMMARRAAGVPHEAKLAAANLKALDKLEAI